MRTVLIVDVHNYYINGLKKFDQVVNYSELAKILPFRRKIAFGRQSEDKVQSFSKLLHSLNYEVRFGGGSYNIEMALCVADMIERRSVDKLVIGSSYFETIHIHEYCYLRGIETVAMGFNVPTAFERYADVIELGPEVLMNEVPVESSELLITV